ncbi:MAG TPA: ABC transporter substrate-binding protein [Thiotrichaceae bacterium]|nr:ABC transporter substrate-binding protein [Thiotrichaceae bacterium]
MIKKGDKILMRQLFANVALAGLFMVASFGTYAADCEDAKAQVKKTTDQVLNALKADASQVYALVDNVVLPSFDFKKMSRQVVPRACWNEGSKREKRSKQKRFVKAFRDLLVRTYSSALKGAAGTVQSIGYSCSNEGTMGRRNTPLGKVKTTVSRQGESQAIEVDYAVYYKKRGNKWKVYNVYAAGMSLVNTYEAEFKGYCNNGGMDNLINKVKNQ